MKTREIVIVHTLIWVVFSFLYFFLSESLTAWMLPEIHDVIIWLKILISGLILIFLAIVISLTIILIKRKKRANDFAN